MDVSTTKMLDLIDDWIENIENNNKVIESLHARIHWLKDQAQEKILEVEKLYSDAWLEIF